MLENAQHFLCHANGLQNGRRINPLTADADKELDMGYLYFLLPMTKLHSVLSGTDMASLALKANSAIKTATRRSSGARILPFFGDLMRPLPLEVKMDVFLMDDGNLQTSGPQEEQLVLPKLNLEDDLELLTALLQLRFNSGKSWKPKLETINEFRPLTFNILLSQC